MPPTDRPIPRFVAEPPHELEPRGRWRERLEKHFLEGCARIESFGDLGDPGPVSWFPERTYGDTTYVPATAATAGGYELFGFVSFQRPDRSGDPTDFHASADYTDETADRNPSWRLDLSDEVIARWDGPGKAAGDLTLIWGTPLVVGGGVVTAELGDETLDQCGLGESERFTLVALDAVTGFGRELYLDVKLWDRRGELVATESLYEA